MRVPAQSTSYSNRSTKHSLRFQLILDEMRKTNSNLSVTHRQKWGLFLLEHLFHAAAFLWQKERQWQTNLHTHFHHLEKAKKTAPNHPSVRSLLGSSEEMILKIIEGVYQGVMSSVPVNSLISNRRSTWQSSMPSSVMA